MMLGPEQNLRTIGRGERFALQSEVLLGGCQIDQTEKIRYSPFESEAVQSQMIRRRLSSVNVRMETDVPSCPKYSKDKQIVAVVRKDMRT